MSVRLRALAASVRESMPGNELPYIGLEHVEMATGRLVPSFEPEIKSADAEVVFQSRDVLFGKLRPYLAKVLIPEFDGCASGEFLVLRPGRQLRPRYLYYVCLSRAFIQWAEATSVGTKMPRTDWEMLSAFRFDLCSLDRQDRVISFLDRETVRIDRVISQRRHLLQLLEERSFALSWRVITGADVPGDRRPSGQGWLGSVPASWSVRAVATQFEVQLGRMLNPERTVGPNLQQYIRNANVRWDSVDVTDLAEMDFPLEMRRLYRLRVGDVLINEGGAGMGRTAIWRGEVDECYFQKSVLRLRPHSDANPRWLVECMRVAVAQKLFWIEGNVATIPHLPAETLGSHRFPFPPRSEQDRLLAWLDEQRGELDRIRALLLRQSNLLQERRQALVTAAVSGQLDIAT